MSIDVGFVLRKAVCSDEALICGWMQDDDFRRNLYDMPQDDAEIIKKHVRSLIDDTSLSFPSRIIFVAEHDTPFGLVQFTDIDWIGRNLCLSMIICNADLRNKGLGPKMAVAAIETAFNALNMHKVTFVVYEHNVVTIALMEHFCAAKEVVLKDYAAKDEKSFDAFIYSILKKDFEELVNKVF